MAGEKSFSFFLDRPAEISDGFACLVIVSVRIYQKSGFFHIECSRFRVDICGIGENAFYGCRGLTLYAVPETAPAGWDARWNSSYRPVLYGCQAEDGVLSGFTKRETATANFNETTSVTAPVRIGYGFAGFATEAGGTAVYAAADFGKIPEGTALFPVWTDPAA